VHALIYKEFSDFFESFTEPILLTSANTFPSTHGYRRFFGPGPMLANLPEKINFRTDSCSGQESFSLLRLPSAVLLGGDRSILLSYGTISLKSLFYKVFWLFGLPGRGEIEQRNYKRFGAVCQSMVFPAMPDVRIRRCRGLDTGGKIMAVFPPAAEVRKAVALIEQTA